MYEKVVAGKYSDLKVAVGVSAPGSQRFTADFNVLEAAEGGYGVVEWFLARIDIRFVHLEICPQSRQQERHQLVVLQDYLWRAVETAQFFDELGFGQVMDGRVWIF